MNTVQNIECVTDLSLLVNTSLVDVVADKIRQNIYTGKYEAGKKLSVRELSEAYAGEGCIEPSHLRGLCGGAAPP